MGTVIEVVDGRRISFDEGAVEAERTFIFNGYSGEADVILNAFRSSQDQIGDSSVKLRVPAIGEQHPEFPSILFCYAYDLSQMPGETDKWRATFRYRRTEGTLVIDSTANIGAGPALDGFEEITARVSGSFAEMYRAGPDLQTEEEIDGDIGGEPIDRAGVPTSVLRKQMEITLNRTVVGQQGETVETLVPFVGTLNNVRLFGIDRGKLVYRGANIQRVETNKFIVSHTWLYDSFYHRIQEIEYTIAGTPKLGGADGDELYKGRAYPVKFRQPFNYDDSHLLAPGFF